MNNDKERERILLAFHLQECFPDYGIGKIADMMAGPIAELFIISRMLFRLEMTATNERQLTKDEISRRDKLRSRAATIGNEIGCGIEILPCTAAAGIAIELPNRRSNNGGGEAWSLWA